MKNKDEQRELCYIAKIDDIRPIAGKDRVECACVGGWTVMVKKGQFNPGDIAVYFEIDSRVPEEPPFEFLERTKYKIKTQVYKTDDGRFYSQGLLMGGDDFGWEALRDDNGCIVQYHDKERRKYYIEGSFLTETLGITYADDADNERKDNNNQSEKAIMANHKKFFKRKIVRYLMKFPFFHNLFLDIFKHKKKKKKNDFPYWVKKTDEERVQNCSYLFPDCKETWVATEKIDGSSATYTMRNDKHRKLYVCSRNVLFDTPEKENNNFYKNTCGNIWLEIADKYGMQEKLSRMIDDLQKMYFSYSFGDTDKIEYVTVQGEIYGGKIQQRNYGDEHRIAVFNVIYKTKNGLPIRMNPLTGKDFCDKYDLPFVPIVQTNITLPSTCQEVVDMAHGTSVIDGGMREGLVFRSYDGVQSFKAVDPEFLIKYHSN